MDYGLTFDQVSKVARMAAKITGWGCIASLTEMPQYSMYRVDLNATAAQPLHFFTECCQAFIESGVTILRSIDQSGAVQLGMVRAGEMVSLPRFFVHGFASWEGAVIYLFGPRTLDGLVDYPVETVAAAMEAFSVIIGSDCIQSVGQPTMDVREKYWGRIETILNGDIAAKRIFIHKDCQSSLEYHVEKNESYYIHSGRLRVGLRIGRAQNRSIVISTGESFDVRPGVMHMRMGLEDTVILEVSTRDSDADSYLVEDGQMYRHIDANMD